MAIYVKSIWQIKYDPDGENITLLDYDDKMLEEPLIQQSHTSEMVGFARAEYQTGFHFGNVGHSITFQKIETYGTLVGGFNAILSQLALVSSFQDSKTLQINVNTGESYQLLDAIIQEVNPIKGPDFKSHAGFQYTISGGKLLTGAWPTVTDTWDAWADVWSN